MSSFIYSDQDLGSAVAVPAPAVREDFAEAAPALFDFDVVFAVPPFLDLAVDDFAVAPPVALEADARDVGDFVVLRAARVADAPFDFDVAGLADVFAEPLAPFVPEERVEPDVLREEADFAPVLDVFDVPAAAAEEPADERLRTVLVALRLERALALPPEEDGADLRDRVPDAALDARRAVSV